MSLYSDLKKFDLIGNPDNKKVYYVTDAKNQAVHPLIETYDFETAWTMIQGTNKSLRLKRDEFQLEFIDVDTDSEQELNDFIQRINGLSYIKIKSQRPYHYHIFFKKVEILKPIKISQNIHIWENWVNYHNLPISLGPDLPSSDEVHTNPRARSAKLRCAVKT